MSFQLAIPRRIALQQDPLPLRRRRYSMLLHVEQHVPAHQITAVEVILNQNNKGQQKTVGSLGIVILGDDMNGGT